MCRSTRVYAAVASAVHFPGRDAMLTSCESAPSGRFRSRPVPTPALPCLLALVLAIGCATPQPAKLSEKDSRTAPECAGELRALVKATMAERRVPGAIVLVDVPGVCEWTAALGVESVITRHAMRPRAHMRIGSITKTFTGTVVLQLVDEGRVKLDDAISRYLAGVPDGDSITIRQLLAMTSGLYNYSDDLAFNESLDSDPHRVWAPDELLAIAFSQPPYFAPGRDFHYSNTNTILLGLLIEKITGHSLTQELEARIFVPLGLRDTSLPPSAAMPLPYSRGYMFGTNFGAAGSTCDADPVGRHDVTAASPSWTWSAGGAISTMADLRIWARALATGALLSPATQAERVAFAPTGPPGAPLYGLHIASFSGVIGHTGALPGFQSFLGYIPARSATVIVLANLFVDAECGSPADTIAKRIIEALKLTSP